MAQVRDDLATLAAGRDGDTTTVLLARADLRSGPPERNRTATFPAGGPAAAAAGAGVGAAAAPAAPAAAKAAPVPAPVAPAADPRPPAPPRTPGARRGRAVWIAAAAVGLALAGLIVFWALALDGDPDQSAAQGSPTATSSGAQTSAEETTGSGASTQPTDDSSSAEETSEAPPDDDPLSADNIETFLEDYHAQVLADPRAAYDSLTGPTLQANVSYETYAEFWGRFSDVQVRDVQAEDGSPTATAALEFEENGERFTEVHQFTLVVGADGELRMDVDVQTG
jgi:hypothetical protein